MINKLKNTLSFMLVLLFGIGTFSPMAEALSDDQIRALDGGAGYVNTEATSCDTAAAVFDGLNPSRPGTVFVIGDSIANGARTALSQVIDANPPWEVYVDAVDGRALQNNTIDLINEDPTAGVQLRNATVIVVELGANNTDPGFEVKLQNALIDIRDINRTAAIYWVTLGANPSNGVEAYSTNNGAILANAPSNYKIIPWANEVFGPSVDITSLTGSLTDINNYLDEDKLHPNSTGATALAQLIFDTVKDTSQTGSPVGSVRFVGSSNAEIAYNYFVTRGLTPSQAAGMVGNLAAESGIMPNRAEGNGVQTISSSSQITAGRGFGIAQWTTAGRQSNWLAFAAERGQDPLSLELQLEFVWHELTTNSGLGLEELRRAPDLRQAVWIGLAFFEIPRPIVDENTARQEEQPNPSTQPRSDAALNARLEVAVAATEGFGDGVISLGSSCGAPADGRQGFLNPGTGEPSFAAIPSIQRDTSPPGAHKDSNCTGTFTPGAAALKAYIAAQWQPPVTGIGGYSCRAIINPTCAPSCPTSIHGLGRALDIMIDATNPTTRAVGDEIRNFLINNAEELGIQMVAWNEHIWTPNKDGWRPFSGTPHTDHIHVEINLEASRNASLI